MSGKPGSAPVSLMTPVCCGGGLLCLLRKVFQSRQDRENHRLDSKLDELACKIDDLARQFTAESTASRPLDEQAARKVREEAERYGIEVARYSQLPQFDSSILDTFIPRCKRLTQLHFGHIVSNPHAPMAFQEKMGYNMTYNLVPPGNGNALHMHRSVEIFVALDGKWEIAWGMQGEHSVVLRPWDFVCVPARVCHSYKNIEEQTAQNIMTILPGKSWITWAPNVVAEARQNGAECDDSGMLLKYAHLVKSCTGLAADAETVAWKSMGPRDMDPYVHRFAERRVFECQMGDGAADGPAPFIEMFWKTVDPEDSFVLPRREGVDLLLVVLDGCVLVKTGQNRSVASAGKLDAVRVPIQAFEAGEVFVHNPCPTVCTILVTATQMRDQNDLYFHLC
uniref:Cupin type-2 domain-containing protein n=1 Tax=Zooxanthella nutricula TaxID=1333877 RepID=A0A7S2PNY2_9DINO